MAYTLVSFGVLQAYVPSIHNIVPLSLCANRMCTWWESMISLDLECIR